MIDPNDTDNPFLQQLLAGVDEAEKQWNEEEKHQHPCGICKILGILDFEKFSKLNNYHKQIEDSVESLHAYSVALSDTEQADSKVAHIAALQVDTFQTRLLIDLALHNNQLEKQIEALNNLYADNLLKED